MADDQLAGASTPAFPATYSDRYYGRRVWSLGEDGYRVMAEGCDRRSWAALNAHARGDGYSLRSLPKPKIQWIASFATSCGCTPEEHEQHIADDVDCVENCEFPDLAPCSETWCEWVAVWATIDGPPALPVLVGER